MSSLSTRTLYRRSDGQRLSIRDENLIGSGGEGAIYTLDQLPDLVAKVYHKPSASIGAKLTLMVDNPPNMPARDGHVSIAWPLDTLHSAPNAEADSVVGFLMRKISGMKEVNQCYNPAARKRTFPHYTYKHLCAVAINIAIVVDAVHDSNYVIGDINESNILVNDNGLVTLIDTDSFQVFDQRDGTIYRSPVGKPEYTPPNLQGHRFDQVDRDVYHDRFGLGVIIYQLLMEGHHPYSGRFTGRGEPPAIEGNISRGNFLHSQNKRVPLVDGPGFAPWHTLDESIRNLFGLCFETGHDRRTIRPPPDMWQKTLTQAAESLAGCAQNDRHLHFSHNQVCPWCDRRNMLGGRDPFPEFARSNPPEPLLMRSADAPDGSARISPAPQPQTQSGGGNTVLKTPPPRTAPPRRPWTRRPSPTRPWPRGPSPTRPSPRRPSPTRPSPQPTSAAQPNMLTQVLTVVFFAVPAALIISVLVALLSLWPGLPWSPFPWNESSLPAPSFSVATPMPAAPALPPPSATPTTTPPPAAATPQGPPATPLPAIPAQIESAPAPSPTPPPPTATAQPTPAAPTPEPSQPVPEPAPAVTEQQTHFPADLIIEDEDVSSEPQNPWVGDTVTFTVTITNQGEGDAGASKLRYTVTKNAEHVSGGEVDVPPIPKGGSESVSFEWTADAGIHTVTIEADADNQVPETSDVENNRVEFHYGGVLLSDLIVESIDWSPDSPAMGEAVTFSVTVRNQGQGRSGVSTVEFYLDDGLIGEGEMSPILPGESETVSFEWNAEIGPRDLRAMADSGLAVSETDEANNETAKTFESTLFSDLIVETVGWEPLNPSVGDDVQLWVTVRNQGTLHAAESVVELLRTSSDSASSNDRGQVGGIPPGEAATAHFRWQAEPGVFTLTARADVDGAVLESDEDNNEYTVSYDATALADLTVADISWEPERPAIGEELTVTVTLENVGGGAASESVVRLFVNDVAHGEAAALATLYPQESGAVSFIWTAETGTHTFRADIDHDNRVVESDETNNASETFEYDHTRLADLTVSEIGWEPATPSIGDSVTFAVVIENVGEAPANGFSVSFGDSSSGWQATEKIVSDELGAGGTVSVDFEWTADADPHRFVAVADSQGEVVESDEDNNESMVEYGATALADLVVSEVAWAPERPAIGDEVTVSVTLKNAGGGAASESTVRLFVDDQEHGEAVNLPVLSAQESNTVNFTWVAEHGAHNFRADIDHDNRVIESDEANNASETLGYDHTRLADLTVKEISWEPAKPEVGDTVTFGVVIENVGEAPAQNFSVSFRDMESVWQPMEKTVSGELGAGGTTKLYFEWPADADPHKFVAAADSRGEVIESDEDNNEHSVEYAATVVADLSISGITWNPANPSLGERVIIEATVKNTGQGGSEWFMVSLAIDGKHSARSRVDGLDPGQSADVRFGWDAEAGPHKFTATADSDGAITETSEDNNEHSVDYDATELADLSVERGVVSVNPDSPTVGDDVTIGLTVLNRSRVSSGRFAVSLYVGRSNQPYGSESVGSIDGRGESASVRFTWTATQGCHNFRAVVDSDGDVVESDEDNNRVEFQICASAKSGS